MNPSYFAFFASFVLALCSCADSETATLGATGVSGAGASGGSQAGASGQGGSQAGAAGISGKGGAGQGGAPQAGAAGTQTGLGGAGGGTTAGGQGGTTAGGQGGAIAGGQGGAGGSGEGNCTKDGWCLVAAPTHPNKGIASMWPGDPGTAWAGGKDSGKLGVARLDGALWQYSSAGEMAGAGIYALWGTGSELWGLDDGAQTLNHWDGSQWKSFPGCNLNVTDAIWGASSAVVWAVGTRYGGSGGLGSTSGVCRWDGKSWSFEPSSEHKFKGHVSWNLNSVWGTSESDVWAVGYNGLIMHRDASSWTVVREDRATWRLV